MPRSRPRPTVAGRLVTPAMQSADVVNIDPDTQTIAEFMHRHQAFHSARPEDAPKIARKVIAIAGDAAAFRRLGFHDLPYGDAHVYLADVLVEQGKLATAIAVLSEARRQGWRGDWEFALGRIEDRLDRGR